ncbi:hypothetical protein RERY_12850 [Rhodococcus erythropolis]|nr:hypothetical protein RERY_12850 [Rhodococcus erythropolis]
MASGKVNFIGDLVVPQSSKDECLRLPPVYSLYSTSQTRTGLDQEALRVTALGGSTANGLIDRSSSMSLSRSSRRCRSVMPVPMFPIYLRTPESSWAPKISDPAPPAAPPDPGAGNAKY